MAVFKCKMCGGSLDVEEGKTVCECEYCGSRQTISSTDDENIRSLFNRANILRMKAEFDKAEDIYEKILQLNSTEAEAYWGLILCKYGVEYVEDPKTMRRVPTCHRTSYDAITADDDYKNALYYASIDQKNVYESEAKTIDEIQKGILLISKREDPYDVFICYKEADENGKRTKDSVIANDIYYQLTQQGFKVFYAAITLEDKLGSEYEPYIFSALNSSKVMLALGTKPEYFNAVWVKNEWSRFLKIMKKDRSKLLIPCYRDMDAYELPEEFAHLQAQDMSKIGFLNDIVRGIKKVIVKDEPKTVVKETVVVNDTAAAGVAPLLKRTAMFLEDGNWNRARELCEQILNTDPENAQAYVYELMCDLQVTIQARLADCAEPFENNKNYQKAIRFASPELQNELQGYIEAIKERNETDRKNRIYNDASNYLAYGEYQKASDLFLSISGWKDADDKREEALKDQETARKKAQYDRAVSIARRGDSKSICEAIDILRDISDSKQVEEKLLQLSELLEKAKKKEADEEKERLRLAKIRHQYEEEYRENLTLIRERDNIVANKRADEHSLSVLNEAKFPFNGFLLILLGIGVFILGIVIHKDPYDPGFIQFCVVVLKFCTIILGPILGYLGIHIIAKGLEERAKNRETKRRLTKEVDEYQKQLEILKDIPTFDEYVKAHKE